MAITKGDILTDVVMRTNRTDVTNIDDELAAIMIDLSHVWPFLEKTDTLAVTAQSTELPSDFRQMKAVTVSSGGALLKPVTISELLTFANADTDTGTPKRQAQFNDFLYVHPVPASSTTLLLHYSYMSTDVNSISFDNNFREALIQGVCYKIYEIRGMLGEVPAAQKHYELFTNQIEALKVRYADRGGP